MIKQLALGWFERRRQSITLADKCAEAEAVAIDCIRESIQREPQQAADDSESEGKV